MVFYVCDRKKSCNKSVTCGLNDKHGCTHTLNKDHALYSEHEWKDFEQDDCGNYWEKIRNEQRQTLM